MKRVEPVLQPDRRQFDWRIDWQIGVEIELLAPLGASRATLAQAVAARHGGSVHRVLHQDSEPSKVPGQPLFYNLTLGFDAFNAAGELVARCVDDLTLQDDLDRQAKPKAGWWRMVSDDERLLRLLAIHTDVESDLPEALQRLAPLFNGQLLPAAGGMYRLVDAVGAPLAIATPLPGERERPCELITPPLQSAHAACIEELLQTARQLGFVIPKEGATHIHFDATSLCDPSVIANLVNLLICWGPCLRYLCGTPAHFRRVGGWPQALQLCVNSADFRDLPWPEAQARLRALNLSKYCDFNLKNIAYGRMDRHTFEARIFPAYLNTEAVLAAASLMEGVLRHCQRGPALAPAAVASPSGSQALQLLDTLQLDAHADRYWRQRARSGAPHPQ